MNNKDKMINSLEEFKSLIGKDKFEMGTAPMCKIFNKSNNNGIYNQQCVCYGCYFWVSKNERCGIRHTEDKWYNRLEQMHYMYLNKTATNKSWAKAKMDAVTELDSIIKTIKSNPNSRFTKNGWKDFINIKE